MNLLSKTVQIGILSLLSTTPALATVDMPGCNHLHVEIANTTNQACSLNASNIHHGRLVFAPPSLILPGTVQDFDIKQTLYGPDITLSYRCNNEIVIIRSQQNFCLAKAGQITGDVVYSDQHINAHPQTVLGSYHESKPGTINWTLNSD